MRLKDKAIAVTGAATGIGRATALCCAQEGARLALGDINEAEGRQTEALVRQAGGNALFVVTDVSREADVAHLMSEAERWLGRIDVLIHVAGVFKAGRVPVDEVEESVWNEVIAVNLKGPFLATKHVVPAMKRAGKGVIIIVASGAGVRGGSSSIPYGSSKGGAHGLSLVLADQLAPFNIRVHGFCPGSIATPLMAQALEQNKARTGVAEQRSLGEPEGVAKVLAFLASDDADYVRGTVFTR